uniref:Uncharacterized protein n=1 Tax=Oryza sativa subsp. japonica TaxID=39947 RepID=Q6I574_ORYSJ|nr:hypothetical protein [Oryza sativa Japonica Group]
MAPDVGLHRLSISDEGEILCSVGPGNCLVYVSVVQSCINTFDLLDCSASPHPPSSRTPSGVGELVGLLAPLADPASSLSVRARRRPPYLLPHRALADGSFPMVFTETKSWRSSVYSTAAIAASEGDRRQTSPSTASPCQPATHISSPAGRARRTGLPRLAHRSLPVETGGERERGVERWKKRRLTRGAQSL